MATDPEDIEALALAMKEMGGALKALTEAAQQVHGDVNGHGQEIALFKGVLSSFSERQEQRMQAFLGDVYTLSTLKTDSWFWTSMEILGVLTLGALGAVCAHYLLGW